MRPGTPSCDVQKAFDILYQIRETKVSESWDLLNDSDVSFSDYPIASSPTEPILDLVAQ
jgi:hypothetical protein